MNTPATPPGTPPAPLPPELTTLQQRFHAVKGRLSLTDRLVLEYRLGIGSGFSRTCEETATEFRMTLETIRQIEQALREGSDQLPAPPADADLPRWGVTDRIRLEVDGVVIEGEVNVRDHRNFMVTLLQPYGPFWECEHVGHFDPRSYAGKRGDEVLCSLLRSAYQTAKFQAENLPSLKSAYQQWTSQHAEYREESGVDQREEMDSAFIEATFQDHADTLGCVIEQQVCEILAGKKPFGATGEVQP